MENEKNNLIYKDYKKFAESISNIISDSVSEADINMYNPMLLAYIGDAVYELFIRTYLITEGYSMAGEIHKRAIQYVEAKSQAKTIDSIFEILTDEEKHAVKRGRNAKAQNVPKSAKVIEYKYATGFESLLGFLYLNNRISRLLEILNCAIKIEV